MNNQNQACGGQVGAVEAYSGYGRAATDAGYEDRAAKQSAPVKTGSLEEKLNVHDKLLSGLHDSLAGLERRLADLLPDVINGGASAGTALPPSMSPLGERVGNFNSTLAGAIERIERIKTNLDL